MTTPGIGHNSGAVGRSWRTFAWKKARKDLISARVPLEIVRIRVRRAEALGLSYPQYASVLLGSGRDIVGFLFTVGGLQLRLARRLSVPAHVSEKLQRAPAATRIALSPAEEPAEAFRIELAEEASARIDHASSAPVDASWGAARLAIHTALRQVKAPADAIVMIGGGPEDASAADAAFLAKYIRSDAYFPRPD